MKAIVVAAGMGRRLRPITNDYPKCLSEVCDKPILDYIIDSLTFNNINDINMVVGYKRHKLEKYKYKKIVNNDYKNNNILVSLMHARSVMDDEIIISYSDIIYDNTVVSELKKSTHDVTVVVDINWLPRYEKRYDNPASASEKAVFTEDGKLIKIGKNIEELGGHVGEFIGLCKFSKSATKLLIEKFDEANKEYINKPFYEADTFKKSYLTDMINYLMDSGVSVNILPINQSWVEIDTLNDLKYAEDWVSNNYNISKP